jgi:eukaryotic-like serine/threonine-protein kinase
LLETGVEREDMAVTSKHPYSRGMQHTEQLNAALAGRYAIDRLIGEGGMATVYLARDIRHNRKVALKVLKPDLGAIVGVDRFLAEIEVTANLQHPNLLPLFDSGAADSLLFYVMPFVEGESLRTRLDREKQLPVDDVVRLAAAIASALDYAHRHNVIHRDLKPENILLHDGQPLVADFGIALAISNAGGNRLTQTGLALGTPLYMSPEQATGERMIDARTDIYSLGVLTYEMLTGEPPHIGNTSQAIIARVLTDRPRSIRQSRPSVPEHVERSVLRALEKLPADRFASAKDFAESISGARAVVPVSMAVGAAGESTIKFVPARSQRARMLAFAPWVLVAAFASMAVLPLLAPEPNVPLPAHFLVELPDSVNTYLGVGGSKVALSTDGGRMLIVARKSGGGEQMLYLRRMDDLIAQPVRGTEGAVHGTFSPDGEWIVFGTTLNELRKVPVAGGQSILLTDTGSNAQWTAGDHITFNRQNSVYLLDNSGKVVELAGVDSAKGITGVFHAEILPGGKFAVAALRKTPAVIESHVLGIISVADGTVTELGITGTNPHYVAPGYLVFARAGGNIHAVPFSLQKRAITGTAILMLQNVSQQPGGATNLSVSQRGMLVYHVGAYSSRALRSLLLVDKQGRVQPIQGEPAYYADPRASPDARRISFSLRVGSSNEQLFGDIHVKEILTGAQSRVTSSGNSVRAEWSRDGRSLMIVEQPNDSAFIRMHPWDRTDVGRVLLRATSDGSAALNTISVGPASGWSSFRIGDNGGNTDVWIAPTDSMSAIRPLMKTPYRESASTVSPDGRFLAYASDETGRDEIYVVPLPVPSSRIAVSVGGGTEPAWSRDGKQLFFRGPQRMMVASIATSPTLASTRLDSLFVDTYFRERWHRQYDVLPDGRFVMLGLAATSDTAPAPASSLHAIMNWQAMLKKE